MDINELLRFSVSQGASDFHLSAGMPPLIRVDGDIQKTEFPPIEDEQLREMLSSIMEQKHLKQFLEQLELDFSYEIPDLARFRVNVFNQKHGAAAAFRTIPKHIASFEEINAPPILKEIAKYPRGIVLVTGATGSGKSTTLATLIDFINQHRNDHIITIEDPIEFVHTSKKCLVNQRELDTHTLGVAQALKSALREDPDVIFVGEMRDLETIRLALTAAETGHLVISSLHTNSAAKTINRVIDVFPGQEKEMVRSMLSDSLSAVISQTLLKKKGGGRIAAYSTMICTPAVRNLIREDKVAQLYTAIQTGRSAGMQTLDQHLLELVQAGLITEEDANAKAENKTLFN